MKYIYTFKINSPITKKVEIQKEIDGKPVTVLEDSIQDNYITYIIKRPNRSDYEEAEFIYDEKFSTDVRKGLLTRSEIIKRFANEDVMIKKVYEEYAKKENELQRVNLLEKTEDNINRKTKLEQELLSILMEIQNFEVTKSSVFDHTAESRARNKTVFWWILNLAYKIEDKKEVSLFEGLTFEDKLKAYDLLMEKEDKHLQEVIQRYFYFIPIWYSGQANKEEDFKKAEDLLKAEINKEKSISEESKSEKLNSE